MWYRTTRQYLVEQHRYDPEGVDRMADMLKSPPDSSERRRVAASLRTVKIFDARETGPRTGKEVGGSPAGESRRGGTETNIVRRQGAAAGGTRAADREPRRNAPQWRPGG